MSHDPITIELLRALKKALEIMPLGTTQRADWIVEATRAIENAERYLNTCDRHDRDKHGVCLICGNDGVP